MKLCYITDRKQVADSLLERIGGALRAGIDLVQIREKDLSARELFDLTRATVALARNLPGRILVNSRADVALAAGAHGVHLPSGSVSPAKIRKIAPRGFVVGVSCHSSAEVRRAASEGADFAVFGPVFETASKRRYGPPQGLARLEEACQGVAIPVYALGGIQAGNAKDCLAAGAAGIAAISLFQKAADIAAAVSALAGPPGKAT
jgi:thiamine-phosphate pyrophosphorylase